MSEILLKEAYDRLNASIDRMVKLFPEDGMKAEKRIRFTDRDFVETSTPQGKVQEMYGVIALENLKSDSEDDCLYFSCGVDVSKNGEVDEAALDAAIAELAREVDAFLGRLNSAEDVGTFFAEELKKQNEEEEAAAEEIGKKIKTYKIRAALGITAFILILAVTLLLSRCGG